MPAAGAPRPRNLRAPLLAGLAAGLVAGLALGAALPFALAWIAGAALPIPLAPGLFPGALALGAFYGLLTALVFSLPPLGRAHDLPVSALFRDAVEPAPGWLRLEYLVGLALATAVLAGSAVLLADDRKLALYYVAGTVVAFAVLRLVATCGPPLQATPRSDSAEATTVRAAASPPEELRAVAAARAPARAAASTSPIVLVTRSAPITKNATSNRAVT